MGITGGIKRAPSFRRRLLATFGVLAYCLFPSSGFTESWRDHLTLSASDRVRGEFVDWFRPAAAAAPAGAERYDFFANQLRAGFRVSVPHLELTMQLQDTRLLNLPDDASPPVSAAGNLGPGALYFANTRDTEQGEPFLKLGYLTLRDLPGLPGASASLGRFEYSDGLEVVPADPALALLKKSRISQRLIGPFGYTHVGRSFDGARLGWDGSNVNVTAIGVRPTQGGFEVSANSELDIWVAGLAATLKRIEGFVPLDARAFYLYYQDHRQQAVKTDNRPNAARLADHSDVAIHTWGVHGIAVADAGPGRADGLLWGVVQAGDWGELDHFAWAYAVEAGFQLPDLPLAPWLRAGFNHSSGDGDPGDDAHETFFQILPTARMYAQLPFFNLMNTQDVFAQLILRPHSRVTVRTDYHWLRLTDSDDLWYAGGGATNDTIFGFAANASGGKRDLAHLVDVGCDVVLHEHLTAYAYFGHAFGQDVVEATFAGAEATYGYVELTLRY